jgi:hypothetical protein
VTNLFDEHDHTSLSGLIAGIEFESAKFGEPRMFDARVKVRIDAMAH